MTPGSQIAHYRITAKLGEGGMGAVYRATDTRLNRDVAIKVLPPAFAEDSARMQRFEREAQVLASLNHPNIAAIYGVEQGAIVMELVEGADLKGPLPADTVIDYARQIASGLETAHEKGIVHRDLKPANIKLTPDGAVKLLDFGLAKAREDPASSVSAGPTMSPTLSLAMTQAGMILGTAAYMSPEQARGKPVDRRSDIWAFGIILYELLTGVHPYGVGETVTDTLAAIVLKEADLTALPENTPARLRRIIERCLRKDPRMRLRDIGDARMLLDEPEPPAAPVAAPPPPRRQWLPWAVAVSALAVAAAAAGIAWMRPAPAGLGRGALRFTIPLPTGTAFPLASSATEWVPSPDGRNLAMVAGEGTNTALWVRPLNSASAHRLDKTEGANYPFWSPDGQSIGFFAETALRRIPVSGGASVKICDLPGVTTRNPGDGGAWNQEGVIVFAIGNQPLMRVTATGGVPSLITPLAKGESSHHWPQFLPDGRHVLYEVRGNDDVSGIYVLELGSTRRVRVVKSAMRAIWSPPGYLLFPRDGNLFAQRMNSGSFQLEGEPLLIAEDVRANDSNGRSTFAASANGVLVYITGNALDQKQISWRDRQGRVLRAIGKPVQAPAIAPSPNGNSAAFIASTTRTRAGDAWVMDLASGVTAPLTHDGKVNILGNPSWSPDSKLLAVPLAGGGVEAIIVASGQSTLLTSEPLVLQDWLPDGGSLLCSDASYNRFSLLSLSGNHALQPVIATPYAQLMARFSPDGKYLAYSSRETGAEEVYVAAFPSFSVKRRVSSTGGFYPFWSKDGRKIFYRTGDGFVAEVEIRTAPGLVVGEPRSLFKFGTGSLGNRFGASDDGERFLIAESQSQRTSETFEVTVMVDWLAELKRP